MPLSHGRHPSDPRVNIGLDQLQHHLCKDSTDVEGAFPPLPPGLHCGSASCLLHAALTSDICRQGSTFLIWQVLLLLEAMFMPGIRMT